MAGEEGTLIFCKRAIQRMECCNAVSVAGNITVAELRQKIQKDAVIRCAVHFINDQNDRLFRSIAPVSNNYEKLIQFRQIVFSGQYFLYTVPGPFRQQFIDGTLPLQQSTEGSDKGLLCPEAGISY